MKTTYIQQGNMWVPDRPRLRGLGDVVASFTKSLGIKPCAPCNRRIPKLNRWVPFKEPPSNRWYAPISGGQGTNYYVSPAGSGSTCSTGTPCSLDTGLQNAVAGDTVILKDGNYTELTFGTSRGTVRSGTLGSPITITAENRHQAIIIPASVITRGLQVRHSYITVSKIAIDCGDKKCTDNAWRTQGSGSIPSETFIEGVMWEDNRVRGSNIQMHLSSVKNSTIRWNYIERDQATDDNDSVEAFYVAAADGTTSNDNNEWYANEIVNPVGECWDIKRQNTNINIHHNTCRGFGKLRTDDTHANGQISFTNKVGPVTVNNNIFKEMYHADAASCAIFFLGTVADTRYSFNVCRDGQVGSNLNPFWGTSGAPLGEVDNNTLCDLQAYNLPNTSGLNFHGNNPSPIASPGAASSACDAEEVRILAEMALLDGNPAAGSPIHSFATSGLGVLLFG